MVQVIRWQESEEADLPQEHVLRKRMQQQGLSPYIWSNGPYEQYAVHSHTYQKVLYCVRGSIRFVLPDATATSVIDLAPGDCMILPPGIRHSAQVGSGGVVCLEAVQQSA